MESFGLEVTLSAEAKAILIESLAPDWVDGGDYTREEQAQLNVLAYMIETQQAYVVNQATAEIRASLESAQEDALATDTSVEVRALVPDEG